MRDPLQKATMYRPGDAVNEVVQVSGTEHKRNSNTADYGHINMIDDSEDT